MPVNYGKLAMDQFVGRYQMEDGLRATDMGVLPEPDRPGWIDRSVWSNWKVPEGWYGQSSGFGMVFGSPERTPEGEPAVEKPVKRRRSAKAESVIDKKVQEKRHEDSSP